MPGTLPPGHVSISAGPPETWVADSVMWPPLIVRVGDHPDFKRKAAVVSLQICDEKKNILSNQRILQGVINGKVCHGAGGCFAVFPKLSITKPGKYQIRANLSMNPKTSHSSGYTKVFQIGSSGQEPVVKNLGKLGRLSSSSLGLVTQLILLGQMAKHCDSSASFAALRRIVPGISLPVRRQESSFLDVWYCPVVVQGFSQTVMEEASGMRP